MLLQTVQRSRDRRITDDLNARNRHRVELRIERAARRTAGYFEDRIVVVAHDAAFRVAPRATFGEGAILRPHAQGKRERAHLVAGDHRVDRHVPAGDELLDLCAGAVETRVIERMVAELKALVGKELHLSVPPLRLLAFDVLVAEERSPRLR